MKSILRTTLVLGSMIFPTLLMAQRYRDKEFNAAELAQLPKYCYAQYVDDKLSSNPEYSIQGCGPFVNHYCGALVDLMRAQQFSRQKFQRRRHVDSAIKEIKYTLDNTSASCWLRPDAEAAMSRARLLDSMLK